MEIHRLCETYEKLRDEAKAERNWSAAHLAYHRIVEVLYSSDPLQLLEDAITKANEAIARHDQQIWNLREDYWEYYTEQIKIYQKVISELKDKKEV